MTKRIFLSRRVIRLAAMGLLLLPAGCAPISADVLQEFALDFARGALAAWLL